MVAIPRPIACVCIATAACGPSVVDEDGILAIVGGTVIDGSGGPPVEQATILVRDGRITRIAGPGEIRLGAQPTRIDASGTWVVPGFVDAHGHVIDYESDLPAFLDFGVTAVRAPASLPDSILPIRDEVEAGERVGPTMRVAGVFIDTPHGGEGWWTTVRTAEEAREEVRRQAGQDVDFIKLYDDLDPALVQAAVDEAHSLGLRVIGHLGRTDWHQAIDAGIDALTHSWFSSLPASLVPASERARFIDFHTNSNDFEPTVLREWLPLVEGDDRGARELGRALAAAGVVVDPTLALVEATLVGDSAVWARHLPESTEEAYVPHPMMSAAWRDSLTDEARRAWEVFLWVTRVFYEEGVVLTTGSDTPNPWMNPGISLHREFELSAEAGIPNADIIRMATKNGAAALGLESELGTIEPGKRANLVVLEGNPLEDISATRRIRLVLIDGVQVRPR